MESMTVDGDIYLDLQEGADVKINARLAGWMKSRAGSLRLEEGELPPFEQVQSVLLRAGLTRTFYASNASLREPRECSISRCPISAARGECALRRRSCSAVILRPECDSEEMAAMFPGDEVLGIKGRVWDCPHMPNGAVIIMTDLVWLPKCERRPYEVEVKGRLFLNDGRIDFLRRTNNALRGPLFERLEPVSLKTKENLDSWLEYLDWRSHLLMATKVGARYLTARIDPRTRNLVFTVVSESREAFEHNRFWERREPVYASPLENSSDEWNYRELSCEECRANDIRKAFGVELGDYVSTVPRTDLVRTFRNADTICPWANPYFADVSFTVDAEVVEKMESSLGVSAGPEEVSEFLGRRLKLPPAGFLTLSSTGDEVLISRQRRAIHDFGNFGSTTSPFLSNYLFDISRARVPEKVEVPEFLNRNLNEGQRHAVATILAAKDIALVQGPPGTGKTTVIAEALWQFVKAGKRVLVVSQSGAAVDNALDRLANIPEIRAIRLQKERKGDAFSDDDSRYSKGNVLKNFYKSLGGEAERRLKEWSELTERARAIEGLRAKLGNLFDRIAAEDQLITEAGTSADELIRNAESAAVPRMRVLEDLGIRVFDPIYNPDWPLREKRVSLAIAASVVRNCREELLTRIDSDIRRLNGLSGDAIVSDEVALKIAGLKRREAEIEERMDNEGDDAVYARLSLEKRDIRREIAALGKESGFDIAPYAKFFTGRAADGDDVKASLAGASGRRELVGYLETLRSRLASAHEAADGTGINRLEGSLREIDARVADAEKRRVPFARAAEELLAEARGKFRCPAGSLAESLEWCDGEITRISGLVESTSRERAIFEPLYGGWLERLAHPGPSDNERVIDEYVESCSIVGVTCTSDTRMLEKNGFDHFDVVIIDEVSKATPPELLMSMVKAEKAILVGDHRQLPPLFGDREPLAMEEIMERDEEEGVEESRRVTRENFRKYERMVGTSLFKEHFERAPEAIKCMLWEQYRMHPDIMRIVNSFYDGRLRCGLKNPDAERDPLIAADTVGWLKNPGHAYWIDSTLDPDGRIFEEQQSGSSKVNLLEVKLIRKALLDLDEGLEKYAKEHNVCELRKTVGVIAFYGHQKRLLRRELQPLKFKHLVTRVDTVDRFQGQERDYVLVSMTRNKANHARNIRASNAYVAKFERINVAFSRARELLLIFGARDMFVDYNVELPPLMHEGKPESAPVYRRILNDLDAYGRVLRSLEIMTPAEWNTQNPVRKSENSSRAWKLPRRVTYR